MVRGVTARRFDSQLSNAALHFVEALFKHFRLSEVGRRVHHVFRVRLVEEAAVVQLKVGNCLHLGLVEPLNALAVFPQAVLYFIVLGHHVRSQPMLLAFVPVAFVAALISPRVDAEPVLLIILVLTLVHAPVVPNVDAHAFHVIFEPLALVAPSVEPRVDTDTGNFVFPPISRVLRPVVPLVSADAMLAAKGVVSFITTLICPCLDTFTVLEIVFPLAFVLSSIHVLVNSGTVGFVVSPVPVVNIAIHVHELALAVGSVLTPLANVLGAIRPGLLTESVSEAALPLSSVNGASLELIGRSLLACLVRVVKSLGHSFPSFFLREVLAASQLFRSQQRDESASVLSTPPCLHLDDMRDVISEQLVIILPALLLACSRS